MTGYRSSLLAAACLAFLVLAGCTRDKTSVGPQTNRPRVLATLPDGWNTAQGGQGDHGPMGGAEKIVFAERGGSVAWLLEEGQRVRVVHGTRVGQAYSAVGSIAVSPDGKRVAYAALAGEAWRMVVDEKEGPAFAELDRPVFSPDGRHVAYGARTADGWRLVVGDRMSGSSPAPLVQYEFSGDSTRIAYLESPDEQGWARLVVSDLAFALPVLVEPRASRLVLDPARTRVAVVGDREGQQAVLSVPMARPEQARRGPPADAAYGLAFANDGETLAYVVERGGRRLAVLGDREAPLPAGDELVSLPAIRPGGKGASAVVASGSGVRVTGLSGDGGPGGGPYDEAESVQYSSGGHQLFAASRGGAWFVVIDGKEGSPFDRVVSPMFSPDGRRVVYRARKDGKRFVVVSDLAAKALQQHRSYEQVFPVCFTEDGKSVAYGVKDGNELAWKVEPLP